MLNPEVRAVVTKTIVSFFEGFTTIEFADDGSPSKSAEDFSLKYLPDGYVFVSMDVYGENCLTIYEGDDGILSFNVGAVDTHAVDNDHRTYYAETHNGITYHVNEAQEDGYQSVVVWVQDGFSFKLGGCVAAEELLTAAYSLE